MVAEEKVAGIIAEYNPFHKGHKYHIEKTREITGAKYIVVVMSGDFVQRGEPALVNKYARTRAALANGADLVIELPMVYATGSAQYFARGGISQLNALRCIDYLSFGSEWADIDQLEEIADILSVESESFQKDLQKLLARGYNYPKARAMALQGCLREIDKDENERLEVMLAMPNHILGLEYIQALRWLSSQIKPICIKREGNAYHDATLGQEYSSATSIRKAMEMEQRDSVWRERICQAMGCFGNELMEEYEKGETVSWQDLLPLLNYQILQEKDQIAKYYGLNEDLAQRVLNTYPVGPSLEDMVQKLHCKNLTDVSIKRAMLHIVSRTQREPYLMDSKEIVTPYVRILGMKKDAGILLKAIRAGNPNRVIQKVKAGLLSLEGDPEAKWLFQQDLLAADLYEQICAMKNHRPMVKEFERQQIIY